MRRAPDPTAVAQHSSELREKAAALADAKRQHRAPDTAMRGLQAAVDAARDAGIDWTDIGAALGLRRGNAYQRFRKGRRSVA